MSHGVVLNFAHELLCTIRVRQPKDLRLNKSILIILPTKGKKHILQVLSRSEESNTPPWPFMHGNFIQYWVNQIPVQFSLYINPNRNLNPSFLTLIIKLLLDHLVFMGAIQCSAKRVYPSKNYSYHLLTKNHHQYLKERVFNNFAVRLRKSLIPEKCWLCSDQSP